MLKRNVDSGTQRSSLVCLSPTAIRHSKGHAYHVSLPNVPNSDSEAAPFRSTLILFEDGLELGPAHTWHAEIELAGGGRYSHWDRGLIFSSGDNSSPLTNGRSYVALIPAEIFSQSFDSDEPVPAQISLGDAACAESILSTNGNHAEPAKKPFSMILELSSFQIHADEGFAYRIELPPSIPSGDDVNDHARSQLRLFESGVELRPPHSLHDDIRKLGRGRYSHFGTVLWFSTRDNSSPLTNGHTYQVLVPSHMFLGGSEHPVTRALTTDMAGLTELQRFDLARKLYKFVWPHTRLPDIWRRIDSDQKFASDFWQHNTEDWSFERKFNLDQLTRLAYRIPGDVAECGTYKGGSAFFLAKHIKEKFSDKQLFLFDSFAGLSSPSEIDGNWWSLADLSCSVQDLRANLASLGELPFVKIYSGWIPDRFIEVADRLFCFVHIDLDLYQPTRASLEFFYSRISRGGMILFDDYGHSTCPGVTAAVDEFMAEKPEPIINLASGGAFIVKE